MRWLLLSILSCFLVAPAGASTIFVANLDGGQEVPPVVTGATGMAVLELNAAMTELAYHIQINGLDLGGQTATNVDDVVALHIHNAPAGVAGAIIFGIINPGQDPGDLVIDAANGTVSGVWDGGDPSFQTLVSQLGNLKGGDLYLNVHSFAQPSGEIRGQILAAVPEPTAALVFGAGFAALGLARRRSGAR